MPPPANQADDAAIKPDIAIIGGGPAGLAFAAICEHRGLSYTLFERSARDVPPRGGCLNLHRGSGQWAMREAGVFETFQRYARVDRSLVHRVFDHHGRHVFSFGEDSDSPEIDRHEIKETLLSGIPNGKIRWRKRLERAERDTGGKIVLTFEDGAVETRFKLVVGADGTFSKIRPLVTDAAPRPYDATFIEGYIPDSHPFHQRLREIVGLGPMVVMGHGTALWIQIQGRGQYNCSFGIRRPASFIQDVDFSNVEMAKELLLRDEFFAHHDQLFQEVLNAIDQPFRPWPLYEMPPEALSWQPSSDVTLIGDAAHTTTPFIGGGANCAMRDAVLLADGIREHGICLDAVAAYEEEMFPLARTMITKSNFSGTLFIEPAAPKAFVETMKKLSFIEENDES